jgi:thiamine-phosphate diphosphorylase
VQIRERDLAARALAALVSAMVALARGSQTRIVVNDRLDVAIAAGAAGVHLRSDSVSPSNARTLAPSGFLIGRSVHNVAEASEVGDTVDYLVAGTVWSTPSKPAGHKLLGVDGLEAVVRATTVPVLAIGGVTLERIPQVAGVGAAGIAAIGLFMPRNRADKLAKRATGSLPELAAAARARYDEAVPPLC